MYESDFYNEYYEKLHSVERKLTTVEENRIKGTVDLIPEDVESVLEVGCGDGRIINRLQGKYEKIYGLDISKKALEQVKTPKIQGSLENLPFMDNSFDIVICCEVLEHLPYPIYKRAIKEIERVSKRYILISVPNNENLDLGMIKCPKCGCSSHIWRHLRSFNKEKLKALFNNFEIYKTKNQLSEHFIFFNFIFRIKKHLNMANPDLNSLCPQCGYSPKYKNDVSIKPKLENSLVKIVKKILPLKQSGGWIIVLYNVPNN